MIDFGMGLLSLAFGAILYAIASGWSQQSLSTRVMFVTLAATIAIGLITWLIISIREWKERKRSDSTKNS